MANRYQQLIIWQLADALRVLVFELTGRPPLSNEFRRKAQLDDAIDSVCRNIAEGFGTKSDPLFARYLKTSRASLNEVTDALRSARLKGYISPVEVHDAFQLAHRLRPALDSLIEYLERSANQRRQRPRECRTASRQRRTNKR